MLRQDAHSDILNVMRIFGKGNRRICIAKVERGSLNYYLNKLLMFHSRLQVLSLPRKRESRRYNRITGFSFASVSEFIIPTEVGIQRTF